MTSNESWFASMDPKSAIVLKGLGHQFSLGGTDALESSALWDVPEIKFAGGIGGPTIPINKRLAQWNSSNPCQLTCMGHFHHYMDGGNFMMNGSLIGYNAYAQTNGFAYEEPQQSFFLIHNRHGGQKSVTAPIWLDGKEHP